MYERLNALRNKHEMTYQQLSDASGVAIGTVKSILTGGTTSPGFEPVCAMLAAMNESIDAFYTGVPAEKPSKQPDAAEEPASDIKIEEHHHFRVMPLRGDVKDITKEAIADVYAGETYRILHNHLRWWRIISISLIALIVAWFAWDITHPDYGLIQYGAANPITTSLEQRIDGILA